MNALKELVIKHFELFLIGSLLIGLTVILKLVPQKLGLLNFFYLPVLAAGHALGRRGGVSTAVCSVLIVTFSILVFPEEYLRPLGHETANLTLNLIPWGGFLILAGYTVGFLQEEKQRQYGDLKEAYIGVLEILSKLLESVDRYTEGHSVRVSRLAMDTAIAMGLTRDEVENVRVAGLLHDIGKFEITTDLIRKAANLTENEREEISKHSHLGANLVSKIGPVLRHAVPLIMSHHEFYIKGIQASVKGSVPLGARIVAIADSYDAIVTDRPYRRGRPPWQALEEIRKGAGTQFDPTVVEAFELVIQRHISQEK
jgi:putative nucleotidyltransferase with HDIG domain